MGIQEWLVLTLGLPLMIAAGIYNTYGAWRTKRDIRPAVSWAVGESGVSGMQAAQLPMTAFAAFGFIALVTAQTWDPDVAPWGAIPVTFFALSMIAMVTGFWVWLFMRPKFLIPPHLRAHPGWVKAGWLARKLARRDDDYAPGHRADD